MKKVFAMGLVAAVMGLVMGCVAQPGDGSEGENEATGEATSALTDGAPCTVPGANIAGGVVKPANGHIPQQCCGVNELGEYACAFCGAGYHDCVELAKPPPPPPPGHGGTPIPNPVVGP